MRQFGSKFLCFLLTGFALVGCSAPFDQVSLSPTTAQRGIPVQSTFIKGEEIYTSTQEHSTISMHYKGNGLYPAFTLVIQNRYGQPVLLRQEHLSMVVAGTDYRLFPYEEFLKRLNDRGRLSKALGSITSIAIILEGDGPGHEVVRTSAGDIVLRDNNFMQDITSAAIATGASATEIATLQIEQASEVYLRLPHSMDPNSWYGGTIFAKLPDRYAGSTEVNLYVRIGADLHHFPMAFSR